MSFPTKPQWAFQQKLCELSSRSSVNFQQNRRNVQIISGNSRVKIFIQVISATNSDPTLTESKSVRLRHAATWENPFHPSYFRTVTLRSIWSLSVFVFCIRSLRAGTSFSPTEYRRKNWHSNTTRTILQGIREMIGRGVWCSQHPAAMFINCVF